MCNLWEAFTRWRLHRLRWQTSSYSLLLIYRPREDKRLSWPSWLTSIRCFTYISGHPSAEGPSVRQRKFAGRKHMFYHCAKPPIHQMVKHSIIYIRNVQQGNDVILPWYHCLNAQHATCFQADLQKFLCQPCVVNCHLPTVLRSYSAVIPTIHYTTWQTLIIHLH